ncbi:hypothetical protein B0H12DRAFT_1070565 [Mycena haematopus]|nr:hypothetical protein B0H12DRAFT_1070565 [Mycena haematopus]
MVSREHTGMKDIWRNRQKYPRRRNLKTKSKRPLEISDAHSSRLAYRTIEKEDPSSAPVQSEASDDKLPLRGRRAHRRIVTDSDSESGGDSQFEDRHAESEQDDSNSDGELEYFGSPTEYLPSIVEDDDEPGIGPA